MPNDGYSYTEQKDIFSNYFLYVADTEPPVHYHRWSWIVAQGAVIARNSWTDLGVVGNIFPNLYAMLMGEPAAKKSTAIKITKRLLRASGYDYLAADKTTKEKFLVDLEGLDIEISSEQQKGKPKYDAVTAEALWGGESGNQEPKEMFIAADEFNEFAGPGNLDFYTTLGNLWDWDSPDQAFTQRVKNTRSISIYQPTISILSGNTPELFARCFPPEAIGSGFLSRLLLIHGERSGRKITWPPPPDKQIEAALISHLIKLRNFSPGALEKTPGAMALVDKIYQSEDGLEDIRFKAYNNRRLTQLLKLAVILATAKFQRQITEADVLEANTILSHAELLMPKALGEFGKSKNSDVANKILTYLETVTRPASAYELWKNVGSRDLGDMNDLSKLMQGLVAADKVQNITGQRHNGFLPKKSPTKERKFVDWGLLTQEERDMI